MGTKTIVSPEPAKVISRVSECMRMLMEAGLNFEDLQMPIDDPAMRQKLVQFWHSGGVVEAQPQTGLVWYKNGTASRLQAEIDYSQSIEQLFAKAKAAGWWVNSSITIERQLDFEGTSKKQPADTRLRNLTITSPIKFGEVWSTDKMLTTLGSSGLAFGLHELVQFIAYREELLVHGIRYITAMGSRFRDDGNECAAYLYLEGRGVDLKWFRNDWHYNDSVGRSRK